MTEPPVSEPSASGDDAEQRAHGAAGTLFPEALRAAISARGASLESLRQSLIERGSTVSVATLSYWRSGRSLPDRGGSMLALAQLEEVLRVPSGFLTGKITPRGPGSAVASGLPTHYVAPTNPLPTQRDDVTPEAVVASGLQGLGLSWDDGLERVSFHDRLEIRPDRTDGAHDVRTVFVAGRAGVDRFGVWYAHEDVGAFPFVVGLSNCRLGRAVEYRGARAVAAEMLLDHDLRAGESAIVEHRMESVGQTTPMHTLFRRLSRPIRELAMEVRFPPDQAPTSATLHHLVAGVQESVPVDIVGDCLRLLEIDPQAGDYGLEWAW